MTRGIDVPCVDAFAGDLAGRQTGWWLGGREWRLATDVGAKELGTEVCTLSSCEVSTR